MPRKKQNARILITGKKLKEQSGVGINVPEIPFRRKGDIRPGWITAEAWPKAVKI